MSAAPARSNKSTNGRKNTADHRSTTDRKGTADREGTTTRPEPKVPRWLVGGVRALSLVSPRLAGHAVAPLFFRTGRRMRVRDAEAAVFHRAHRRSVPFEGDRIAAYEFGTGARTAVLVHGWSGRATQLAPFVTPLLDDGWRVVAFDHLGHGDSMGRATNLPQMARAMDAVVEATGGADAAVAHSLGAAATVLAMSDGLALRRVALLAPPSSPVPWVERFGRLLELDAPTLELAQAGIERRSGRRLSELDGPTLAAGLRAPALIVHDQEDREVPLAAGRALHAAWAGSALEVTAGLGHNRLLRAPQVISRVRAFIGADATHTA